MVATKEEISKIAALMGQKGGRKGGPARAAKLSPEERSDIAKWASLTAKISRGKELTRDQEKEYKRLAKKFNKETKAV